MYVNPQQARTDAWITPGVPITLTITGTEPWPADTYVHVGPLGDDGEIDHVVPAILADVDGTAATVTLDEAAMAAILAAYPAPLRMCPWHVRTGAGESERVATTGVLRWDVTGAARTSGLVTVVTGPVGVSVKWIS